MNSDKLRELESVAQSLKPTFSGRVSWDPGDPICPEWVFPLGANLAKFLELALRFHLPIGCWPVGPPDAISGVRVVVGAVARTR